MGNVQHGVYALLGSVLLLGSGVIGASAQDDEGPNEVESTVAAGTLDDGADLLSQAGISINVAIDAAKGAASGAIGEVDLEYASGTLVYTVDVGKHDVHVDAISGEVVSVDAED